MTDILFSLTNLLVLIIAPVAVFNLSVITFSYFVTPLVEAWTEKKRLDRKIWEAETEARLQRLEKRLKQYED
jgi:hypothetical protein